MPRDIRISKAAVAALIAVAVATLGLADPASAKPPSKPGNVTGLALSATLAGSTYTVDAAWNPASNATSYRVTMTDAVGVQLGRSRVTTPSFEGTTTLAVTSKVNLEVVPFNGTRRGRAATGSLLLPDLTAPVGSYTLTPQSSSDGNVSISQSSLADNVSLAAAITQTIDWGDGSPTSSGNGTVSSFPHAYGSTKAVYYPVVTVVDAAGNASSYPLTAVVADTTAPTGAFTAGPSAAWARWTDVTLTLVSLQDDLSASDKVVRSVDWGDGTIEVWAAGDALTHRYATPGGYTPTVSLTDEAGNTSAPLATSLVSVTADATAPRVRWTVPRHRQQLASSWTVLRGHARDAGTGVRKVSVKAIEKRGDTWYAYRPLSHTWKRVGSHQARAWAVARAATGTLSGTGWTTRLRGLKPGLLVSRASAIDHVGNHSSWRQHQQRLQRA